MKMHPIDKIKTDNRIVREFVDQFRKYPILAIETSIKITSNKLSKNRILIGISNENISIRDVKSIAMSLDFPIIEFSFLEYEFNRSDSIGFSLEEDDGKINYRIYLETASTVEKVKQLKSMGKNEVKTITSFKWDKNPINKLNQKVICTDYFYQFDSDKSRLEELIEEAKYNYFPEFLRTVFDNKEDVRLYAARDMNTIRQTFYVFLKNKYLKDISDDVFEIYNKTGIRDELSHLSELPIDYFGGGIDKSGNKVVNIYFIIHNEYAN